MPGQKSLKEEIDQKKEKHLKQTKSPMSREIEGRNNNFKVTLSGGQRKKSVWFSLDIVGQEIVEVG